MKLSINSKLTALLAVSALAMTGCQDEDFGFEAEKISFQKNFINVYGKIDPTQDWNVVTRAAVTVTPGSSDDIKIYAAVNGAYKVVGHYSGVTSTQTLGIDVVEGTTKLLVTDGIKSLTTEVGGSVNLASTTRTVTPAYGNADQEAGVSVASNYTIFSGDFISTVLKNPGGVLPEEQFNLGNVTQNFNFVSTGPFTFYPLYWNTSSTHVLGIYWRDAYGKIHTQDVYTSKAGDELAIMNDGIYDSVTPNGRQESSNASSNENVASKGITVSLPVGTVFGMYLDVYTSGEYKHTVYSESSVNKKCVSISLHGKENPDPGYWFGKNKSGYTDGQEYVFGATFETEVLGTSTSYKFFCFEDWNLNGPDLNDLLFVFSKDNTPITVDETADNWIICAEDLGNTLDIDYNDIVLEVAHISGESTATITPLAAGGTLASYIFFNSGELAAEDQCIGEIHSLYGVEPKISGSYSPINVDNTKPTFTGTVIQKTISVPTTWSLASYSVDDWDEEDSNHSQVMGGFNVKVVPAGTMASETAATTDGMKVAPNTTTGTDNVPYIFCVPKVWSRDNGDGTFTAGKYRWPMENVPMVPTDGFEGEAYYTTGHSFDMWVTDKENNDWYAYPNLSNTVSDTDPITKTASSSSDVTIDITDGFVPEAFATMTFTYNNQPLAQGATIEVDAGQDISVWVASNSSGAWTYSSENSMTASAVRGNYDHECKISAHSKGVVTIYVTQARWIKDSNITYRETVASFKVKVNAVKQNPTLSLSASSISIGSDIASNNDISVLTNSDGVISISNNTEPEIASATISDGRVVITPLREGATELTISVASSEDYNAAIPVTLSVTITAPQHNLTCDALSSYTFTAFNDTKIFNVSSSTNGEISVVSSDPTIATAYLENGHVTITSLQNGSTTVTITVSGDGYLDKTLDIPVSVENYTVISLDKFNRTTGKGGLSKDLFGNSTAIKITFVLGTKQNTWDNNDFGLYLYAASETDITNGYSNFNIHNTATLTWNKKNEVIITAEQMATIKEQGYLGYEFKSSLRDQLLKVYFEDL